MRRRAILATVVLAAFFSITGCGEDNNDNGDGGTTSTPTPAGPTPTAVPATPTGAAATPTVADTTGLTPTPVSTASGQCEGNNLVVTVTTNPGSDLDTGWTGIAHQSVAVEESAVSTNLNNCNDDGICDVDGSNLVGTNFGSPLPLSSGGVPVCVINTFREAVTGTYDCATGCSESDVRINSAVFLVQDIAKPCPVCSGDPTPNDGQPGGTCDSGATPGAACDVGGISPVFGATSNACLPSGSPVSTIQINLSPLTTGTVTRTADQPCISVGSIGSCYCPEQNRPNACDNGICPESGLCASPIDAFCSNQKFRACTSGTGTADCEDVFPGAGTCIDSPRPCFGQSITRTGQCGTQSGTLVSIFCIPRVAAPAVNTTAGLPGPGALSLPARQVRVPR